MASQRSSTATLKSDRDDSVFTNASLSQRRWRADTTTTPSLATIHSLIGSSGQAPSTPRILSSLANEGDGYSKSTPALSSPIGASFLFPQQVSLPGESPLRYHRHNSSNSQMTSSSAFSDQCSSLTSLSPSVRYHVDSATLFGDVDKGSPARPSSKMKGHELPKVSRRPPRPPPTGGRQEALSTPSISSVNQARVGDLQLKPEQPYSGKGNVWPRMNLPLHGPTPKRDDLNATVRSTLSPLNDASSCISPESSQVVRFLFPPAPRSAITTGRDEELKSLSPSTDTCLSPFSPAVTSPTVPSFLTPQETTLTAAGGNGGQRPLRKLSVKGFMFQDYSPPTPPTPSPNTSVKRLHLDDQVTRRPKRRIPVGSTFKLEDWSTYQSSPGPSCCNTGADSPPSEQIIRKRIHSSTPKISRVPYGIKSVTPIHTDPEQSQRYYDKGSPSLYFESQQSPETFTDSPPSPPSRHPNISDNVISPGQVKRRRAQIEFDYSKLMKPFPGFPPKVTINSVESLTCCTFNNFVKEQAVAVIMFYNGYKGKPDVMDPSTKHTLKLPRNTTPAFASVDCARESQLCANEGIRSHPFYKMYVDGYLVSAVKEFGLLEYK